MLGCWLLVSPPPPAAQAGCAALSSMASPPPDGDGDGVDGAAICCMCGDHGLPHELFRCRFCRVRLQHRYCSDLYPRATAYRRCNWCLRETPAEGGGAGHAQAQEAATKPTEKRKAAASTSGDEERQRHEAVCSTSRSRRSAAEVGRPVKKRKSDERVALPPTRGVAKGNSGSKKPMQAAGKMTRPGRVKVRRYKLLTEVISC